MKEPAIVDAIMLAIPAGWRMRWCGGEAGPCACMGCVQAGNLQLIARKAGDAGCFGDPEHLDARRLREHAQVWDSHKITRDEWLAWKARQP